MGTLSNKYVTTYIYYINYTFQKVVRSLFILYTSKLYIDNINNMM